MSLTDWVYGNKCCRCATRDNVKHKEEMGTMAGTIRFWYCNDCYKEKTEETRSSAERSERLHELRLAEDKRDKYHAWLKREVEIIELEKKAEQLGFKFKDRYNGQV